MNGEKVRDLATRYTAAWCSQEAARVASHFAENAMLKVRFSGYEEWTIGADGLIVESLGHFDEAEYQRQLQHGIPASPQ